MPEYEKYAHCAANVALPFAVVAGGVPVRNERLLAGEVAAASRNGATAVGLFK